MTATGLTWSLVTQLTDQNFGVPTDVTFHFVDENDFEVVGEDDTNDEVKAHRLILALVSQKFKDMFYNTSGCVSDVIVIKNVTNNVFAAMISFIYGSQSALENLSLCELSELVKVAEEYGVVGVVQTVSEIIESFSVSEENLLEAVKTASEFEKFTEMSRMLIRHCAAFIKAAVKDDSEIEEFVTSLDENKSVTEKLLAAMTSLSPPPCSNCLASPCLDNTTIPHTEKMVVGCQVAVKNNNCPDRWGPGTMAQHGRVTKVPSPEMVGVRWCDGSESDYNVHLTDKKDDPQLVYHCGAEGA